MNAIKLLQFFDSHRDRGEPLVLVTVYDTVGSTYSKAGAQMLVAQDGVFRGMLSGGCLEGDLAIRARQVLDTGAPQTVTYDLGADDDELFGIGVGCDGVMRMLLQPLLPKDDYKPFAAIADILRGHQPGEITIPVNAGSVDSIAIRVEPPPSVLVLGAGLDAEPVVSIAADLGWRCTVYDHRPAYIDNGDFAAAEQTVCAPAERLSEHVDLAKFTSAIVMSHHLVSDRHYLLQLANTDIAYVGLLGPRKRRERLLDEIGGAAEKLELRLHGPAGLPIGGRGPGPIALSIIAEMQQQLKAD